MTWFPGAPKEKGIYWFDPGFNLGSNHKSYLVAQFLGEDCATYVYGHHGSMPISMVYSPKVSKNAQHKKVKIPSGKWLPRSKLKKAKYAWVKSPEGYIGFCFLNMFSVIWESNPHTGYECGTSINPKYLFHELP